MTPERTDPVTKRDLTIGILVVAYNAVATLARTLDRIPAEFRARIAEVLVCDDASDDQTYLMGVGYQHVFPDLPITVIRHERNLGYGGNQKAGYRKAAELGLDIVVLLHADGQYAPELLPEMVAPLERGECDAVFGSRMMNKGGARAGGMPMYKYVGNRILTRLENKALGSNLSEFHSGYRAYSVPALAELDLSASSDGFNFDTQIIIALLSRGKRIVEIPIPTFYGDEISYVNGLRYAVDVMRDVGTYRLAAKGLTPGELAGIDQFGSADPSTTMYRSDLTRPSQTIVMDLIDHEADRRILTVGYAGDRLAGLLRERGHQVTDIRMEVSALAPTGVDAAVCAALEQRVAEVAPGAYDVAIAADVLEHVPDAAKLLRQVGATVRPGGRVILSVPNFGHWYPRLRTLFGVFDYDQRGILDQSHLRFFTRRSVLRMVRKNRFSVLDVRVTGIPVEVLGFGGARMRRLISRVDAVLVRSRPTLFGYQFVLAVAPVKPPTSITFDRVNQAR